MDKREFIQRYMLQNYDLGNMYHDIDVAEKIFDAIEETMSRAVNAQNLWDYNDK
jgi:hypothetical protein